MSIEITHHGSLVIMLLDKYLAMYKNNLRTNDSKLLNFLVTYY